MDADSRDRTGLESVDAAEVAKLVDYSVDGIVVVDQDGIVQYANPAATAILDRSARDLMGSCLGRLLVSDQQSDMTLLRSDGSTGTVEIRAADIMWNNTPAMVVSLRDISDLRQKHAAGRDLENSETRYRRLFENSTDGILLLNAETGAVEDVNPFLEKLLCIPREELLGKKLQDLRPFKDALPFSDFFRELQDKKYSRCDDLLLATDDGRILNVELVGNTYSVGSMEVVQCSIRDVSARKRVEEALRKSEARLRQAQRVAQLGYWELGSPGGAPSWSDEIFHIFGLDPRQGEPSFPDHRALMHPDDWPVLENVIRNGFENGIPFDLPFRILRPDGQLRWMHAIGTATRNEEGAVVKMFGTAQDITERKLAEEELRRNESRLTRLLRINQYDWLEERELLDRAVEEALFLTESEIGYIFRRDEGSGRFLLGSWSIDSKEARAVFEQNDIFEPDKTGIWIETVQQGGPIVINDPDAPGLLDIDCREGRPALSRFLSIPVYSSGEVVAVVGVADKATDYDEGDVNQLQLLMDSVWRILERQRLHRELRESEAKYRLLADNITDVIWTADLGINLTYISPSQIKLTGFSPEETLALPLERMMTPDSIMKASSLLAEEIRAFVSGKTAVGHTSSLEIEVYRKDGSTVWVEVHASLLLDAQGRPNGVLGVSRDITERRKLQAGVAQSDRLASMGMLAAGVAHEINNPLTYVLYNLQSLSEDVPRYAARLSNVRGTLSGRLGEADLCDLLGADSDMLDPSVYADMEERFKYALEGSRRIKNIVRGLGTFARVEKADLALVDIRHSVDSALNIAFNEIKYRARIVKDLDVVPPVLGSEGRLAQVFLNLLINAAHAIKEGNVEQNRISIRTWQEKDTVHAEVSDTGCGISKENMARIFDPFFTTKPMGFGSGLGLGIVRSIVNGFGGEITVESEVEKGTRFLIKLPAAAVAPVKKPSLEHDEACPASGRVLIIDDEVGIRKALRRILRQHEVVEADSGEQGCALLAEDQAFDVILCDMMMPRLSGIDVHKWLIENHPHLARRVAFLTGGAFTPNTKEYLERVPNLRVEKPFDSTNLKKMVAEWVAASKRKG